MFIIIFLRERERQRQSASQEGAERERENLKQAPGSELSAKNGPELTNGEVKT